MPDRVPGLAECLDAPYPVLWSTCADPAAEPARGSRAVHPRLVPLDAEDKALEHAADCARKGACVLVLRNKVDTATQSARHLETLLADAPELLFTVHGVLTLHHSRFTRPDRRLLDNAVEARFGKGGTRAPGVLVATQTLEQSLDVDFDVIITDLCPIDVLLQRIGRLQRHRANDPQRPLDFRTATCLVLAPSNGAELLDEPVQRVLNAGLRRLRGRVEGRAYTDLRVLTLTLNLLHEAADTATPWRIPRDNRRLVESATHPERLEACNALGPEWEKHGQYVEGQRISHGQQALICLIDWSKPYGLESAGIQEDEAVRTRLGLDDVSIPFPDGIPGPFGNMVDKLTIPRWMAPEAGPDHAPTQITAHDGDVRFHFAGHWFRYGRHGLHKEEQ
jgi:CRISPR-associated endonuclease/helicase Cas3